MPQPPITASRALGAVALGAASISFAPILVKGLVEGGMGPTPIAAWRVWMAAAMLFGFAGLVWRRLRVAPAVLRVTVIAGVAFALDLFVWHWAIVYVGAGMATILGNTQVFWTALLGRLLFGERLTARFAVGAGVAFTGVVLLTGVGSSVAMTGDYLLGVVLGLATGVVYGAYIIALRHANLAWEPDDPFPPLSRAVLVLAWTVFFGGICLTVLALIEGGSSVPADGQQLLLLFGLALGVQIIGWLAISWGLPKVAAARAALVLLTQPMLAAVWGFLFFAEELAPLQLVGAGLTLTGVYLGSVMRSGSQRPRAGQPGSGTRS